MTWRRAGFVLTLLMLIGTAIVTTGVGQGNPPAKLPLNATAQTREIRVVEAAGAEVKLGEHLFQAQGDSVNAVEMNIKMPPDDDKGYEAGLMPENFGSRLSASDLHAVAVYIHAAASAAQATSTS